MRVCVYVCVYVCVCMYACVCACMLNPSSTYSCSDVTSPEPSGEVVSMVTHSLYLLLLLEHVRPNILRELPTAGKIARLMCLFLIGGFVCVCGGGGGGGGGRGGGMHVCVCVCVHVHVCVCV